MTHPIMSEAKAYCNVAKAGASLFPALAAAIVSSLAFEKGLPEKDASALLKEYIKHFPSERTAFNRLSAVEQWKAMIRPCGAAVNVSVHLAGVLQKLCYQHFEENPAEYCYSINGLHNFDKLTAQQIESATRMIMLQIVADLTNTAIILHEVDGQKTLAANYHFNESAPQKLHIRYDKTTGEYQALLQHPERFKSMQNALSAGALEPQKINISFFINTLKASMEESIHRYAVMFEANEISKDELIKLYIKSVSGHDSAPISGEVAKNINVASADNYSSQLPSLVKDLIFAIAWSECSNNPNYSPVDTKTAENTLLLSR